MRHSAQGRIFLWEMAIIGSGSSITLNMGSLCDLVCLACVSTSKLDAVIYLIVAFFLDTCFVIMLCNLVSSCLFMRRLQQLISFKGSRMILFCFLLYVLALWVTFVMLEDWLLPCLVLDLDFMFSADVLYLNNATNCNLHFNFCFRDQTTLH